MNQMNQRSLLQEADEVRYNQQRACFALEPGNNVRVQVLGARALLIEVPREGSRYQDMTNLNS